jgi:hypothetical protein
MDQDGDMVMEVLHPANNALPLWCYQSELGIWDQRHNSPSPAFGRSSGHSLDLSETGEHLHVLATGHSRVSISVIVAEMKHTGDINAPNG